jgi:hypothetical protein
MACGRPRGAGSGAMGSKVARTPSAWGSICTRTRPCGERYSKSDCSKTEKVSRMYAGTSSAQAEAICAVVSGRCMAARI